MEKHIREFQKDLEEGGLKLLSLGRTGKSHYKATIQAPDGRTMVYTLANSPSDHRAAKNRNKDVKRFFNN